MIDQDAIPSRKWTSNWPASNGVGHSVPGVAGATDDVANIYNQAGDDYVTYADGDPSQPFAFDGLHAYADRCVWAALETKLAELRATGASSVRFLDAGCGPGTWLRRLVLRALALGFSSITAAAFGFHLFTAVELRNRFSGCFDIEDLRGLDLFHCRFTPDSRWNPVCSLGDSPLADELERLEKACAARPGVLGPAAPLL